MFKCRARVYVDMILIETTGETIETAKAEMNEVVEWLTTGEIDSHSLISIVPSDSPTDLITWEEK